MRGQRMAVPAKRMRGIPQRQTNAAARGNHSVLMGIGLLPGVEAPPIKIMRKFSVNAKQKKQKLVSQIN